MYLFVGGGGGRYKGKNITSTDSKWRPVPSIDAKPDRNLPLWSKKWKENLLQNTRLQRNSRRNPKSDDNMNDSCLKTFALVFTCVRPR